MARTIGAVSKPSHSAAARGDAARRKLLESGLAAFAESGPAAASTRDIAKRAGQNIAAIAYHFGSKEGLYLAVAEMIVSHMLELIGPVLDDIETLVGGPDLTREKSLQALKRLMGGLSRAMTTEETVPITRIVLREQFAPTAAYTLIHERCINRMHRAITALVAAYLGDSADSRQAIVRAHAFLGAVLGFRVAHETILRRTGWKKIGPAESRLISDTVTQHAEVLLKGLRAERARGTRS